MDLFEHDSLEFMFSRVIKLYHHRLHKLLNKIGLYKGQPFILFTLAENDGIPQKELAEKIQLKAASISVMIRRMEKVGLVERKGDRDDLRISRVYLTAKGSNILGIVEGKMKTLQQKCFQGFTPEEKVLLRRFFLQISENLSEPE